MPLIWILGMLAVSIAVMSSYTVNSLSIVSLSTDRASAEALTRGIIEQSMLEVMRTPARQAVFGHASLKLNTGSAGSTWVGEGGRIDINLAAPELIQSLLQYDGLERADAERLTRLVMQRRGPQPDPGAVAPPATPAGGQPPPAPGATPQLAGPVAFRHIRELELAGFPANILRRIASAITVYGGSARIDPRIATREVLASLPGMTEARLRDLLALRAGQSSDESRWSNEAGEAARFLQLSPARAVRLRTNTVLGSGYRRVAEVVAILFSDDKEPYRILDWNTLSGDQDAGRDLETP